jgi:tRNA dimethylallyltransferase
VEGAEAAGRGPATILILGPTAVGKSALALALAHHLDLEIVNADALQVYRGLNIGTSKPSPDDRALVPHHLIDILDPDEPFSAGDFRRRALPVIADIRRRGKTPVVVGGSGFYLRTLVDGISPIPPIPEAQRRTVRALWQAEGLESVRRRLRELDPESSERIAAGDTQRTLRALEVVLATGRGLADWWASERAGEPLEVGAKLGLTLPRALLYDRISRRVERMAEAGWVQEVADLLAAGWAPISPAFQAIGYRQVVHHLRGELSLDQALGNIARETRRFAKRQLTWFRKEPAVDWIEAEPRAGQLSAALSRIGRGRKND